MSSTGRRGKLLNHSFQKGIVPETTGELTLERLGRQSRSLNLKKYAGMFSTESLNQRVNILFDNLLIIAVTVFFIVLDHKRCCCSFYARKLLSSSSKFPPTAVIR